MSITEIVKDKKIALYGLSTETERIIKEWDNQYQIVGLLDGFQDCGELYGLPILSFEQAVSEGVAVIVVVARPGSCKAIAKRIGDGCRENAVALFDIRGKNLLEGSRVVYDFNSVTGYQYREVVEAVREAEAVSFDLFDTLVVRNTLYSSDVIDIVDAKLKEQGFEVENFASRRLAAEKRMSLHYAPKLEEIYAAMDIEKEISSTSEQLATLEYETDSQLLIPRATMVSLLKEAKKNGKKIYITTDSYYSQPGILRILEQIGITEYDDVLISCEYGTGKQNELFEALKEIAGTKNILHIGDDIVSDIESAKRHGIKVFRIYSTADLLDMTGGMGLVDEGADLSDRIRVGMFAANLLNSPFQFEGGDKRIQVQDASDIGYLFCAPMIHDFTCWFGEKVARYGVKNIWFCARDGYLIQALFSKIFPSVKTEYFLTSRISAIRAGMETEADIAYVDGMKFSGTVEDNLFRRFGIEARDIPEMEIDSVATGLLRYKTSIQKTSAVKKRNNEKYIEKLDLSEGTIAFFDFVAKGTSQMYVERLLGYKIKGFYFLQLEPDFMKDKDLDIEPFYTEAERENSAVFDNYYILETLLTSPEPSVDEFDEAGNPVYAVETRSKKDIDCFMRAQDGIRKYTDTYLKSCPNESRKINKKLDEVFLALIHNVEILDQDFLELKVEDPFFNRMTDITDIL
jgi:HAD superfamily hydrolase (TIGR01549 family)